MSESCLFPVPSDAEFAAALRRTEAFMLSTQYLLATLFANYWWSLAPSNRASLAQSRAEWYDAAACRAITLLTEAEADEARTRYHKTYILCPSHRRDTLCLAYLGVEFIIV